MKIIWMFCIIPGFTKKVISQIVKQDSSGLSESQILNKTTQMQLRCSPKIVTKAITLMNMQPLNQ